MIKTAKIYTIKYLNELDEFIKKRIKNIFKKFFIERPLNNLNVRVKKNIIYVQKWLINLMG